MNRSDDGISVEPQVRGTPARPWGVLVVDDNEAVRAFLEVGLRASGFAVWLAADGYEAVLVYGEHGAAIDLLLLDIRMPGRDGPETLAALRAHAPDLPCCFMSGDTGHYTEEELLGFGALGVLGKPFRLGEVITQLRRQIAAVGHRGVMQEDRSCDDG